MQSVLEGIIHNAIKNPDQATRNVCTQQYVDYQCDSRRYLVEMAQIVLSDDSPVRLEACILLSKYFKNYSKSDPSLPPPDPSCGEIYAAMLSRLSQTTDLQYSRFLADIVGQFTAYLILANHDISIAFEYMRQALAQDQLIYHQQVSVIVQTITVLSLAEIQQYLDQLFSVLSGLLQSHFVQIMPAVFTSFHHIISSNQFNYENDTVRLTEQQIDQIIRLLLYKIDQLLPQVLQFKQEFTKIFETLSEMIIMCFDTIEQYKDRFLEAIISILQVQDESIFSQAIAMFESFVLSLESYEQPECLSENYRQTFTIILSQQLIPYFCKRVDQDYKDAILFADDFEEADDRNSCIYNIYMSLRSVCSSYPQITLEAYRIFKQNAAQYSMEDFNFARVLVLDSFVQNMCDDMFYEELCSDDLRNSKDGLVQFKLSQLYIHVIKYQDNNQVKMQFCQYILQHYVIEILQSSLAQQYEAITASVLHLIAVTIQFNNFELYLQNKDMINNLVSAYAGAQRLQIQTQVFIIISNCVDKLPGNVIIFEDIVQHCITQLSVHIQSVCQQQKQLSTVETKYFCQLINVITLCMCKEGYKPSFEHISQQLVDSLMQLLLSDTNDKITQITDQVLESICRLAQLYAMNMVPYLRQILQKFGQIFATPFIQKNTENLVQENDFIYNGYVLDQHKMCTKTISQLISSLPDQMLDHLDEIVQLMQGKQAEQFIESDRLYVYSQLSYLYLRKGQPDRTIELINAFFSGANERIQLRGSISELLNGLPEVLKALTAMSADQRLAGQMPMLYKSLMHLFAKLVQNIVATLDENISGQDGDSFQQQLMEYQEFYKIADKIGEVLWLLYTSQHEANEISKLVRSETLRIAQAAHNDIIFATVMKELIRSKMQLRKKEATTQLIGQIFPQLLHDYIQAQIPHVQTAQFIIMIAQQFPQVVSSFVEEQEALILDKWMQLQSGQLMIQSSCIQFKFLLATIVVVQLQFGHDETVQKHMLDYLQQNMQFLDSCSYLLVDCLLRKYMELVHAGQWQGAMYCKIVVLLVNLYYQREEYYAQTDEKQIVAQVISNNQQLIRDNMALLTQTAIHHLSTGTE